MGRVMLDSSVLIALLNPNDAHHGVVVSNLGSSSDQYEISAIALMETLVAPFAATPAVGDRICKELLGFFKVIHPVDVEVAVAGAKVRARTQLKVPDALISAMATRASAELWTLDRKLAKAHKGAVLIA